MSIEIFLISYLVGFAASLAAGPAIIDWLDKRADKRESRR